MTQCQDMPHFQLIALGITLLVQMHVNVSFVICFIDLVEEMGRNYMRMHQ